MSSNTSPKRISLVNITTCSAEMQLNVRDIRNEPNVRKWMYTDHEIDANEHLAWISRLKADDRQIVFVVLDEQSTPLGVVSVNLIDRLHKKCDWAFYLTEAARGGLGSALEVSMIEFVFNELGLEKLNCEVIEGNDPVVKMHKKFLFEDEGFRRSNILKNGARIGVHFLGLTKDDWQAGGDSVLAKFDWVFKKFSVTIEWQEPVGAPQTAIEKIEKARAKNNLNWMSILRLAVEASPNSAKPIISEIRKLDSEITELTRELVDEIPELAEKQEEPSSQ